MAGSSSNDWRATEQASDDGSLFDGDLSDAEYPDHVMFGDDNQHSEYNDEHLTLPGPLLEMSNNLNGTEDPQWQSGSNAQLHPNLPAQLQQVPLAQPQPMPLAQPQPMHIAQPQPQPAPHMHPNGYPILLPHQQPAAHTTEDITRLRGTCGGPFVPRFRNMRHAYTSYPSWLALSNEPIVAGSNNRDRNEYRLDDVPFIQELYEAFRNTDNTFEFQKEEKRRKTLALENPDEEFPKSINKGTDEIDNYDLEMILWRLLNYIHDAQEGKTSLPPTYSIKTKGYGAFPHFRGRLDKVKECLTQSKLMCKDLLNGDDCIARLAWNPSAELRRKHQNSHGNSVRDAQNRTAALAINQDYIRLDTENGKVLTKTGEELGQIALPQRTKALEKALEDIPTREGSTDVAKCQEKMGIKRKRTQGKPRARPAKRARAASQAAGSEASATPASDDQVPVSQPYGMEAPQLQAPQLQAPVMQHFESNDRPSDFEFDMFAPGNAVQAPMPSVDGLQFLTYLPDQEGQSSMAETPDPEAPIDDEVQGSMNANGNNPQVPQDPEIHIGSYSERLDGITMPNGTLRAFTEEDSGGECLPQYMRSDFNPAGHNYGAPMNDPQAHSHALLGTYSTGPQGPWSSESHNHQAVLNEWYGNRNAGPYSHLVMEARQPTRSHRVRSTNSVTGDRHAVPPNGAQQPIRSRQVRSTNPVTGDHQHAVPPNGAQLLGPGSSSAGTVPHSVFYRNMNRYYVKPKSSGASGHGN
ncbi:hypothetical protein PG989_004580 [Apiospora arundinis]